MDNNFNIAVLGLGYVGLPLAMAMAKHFTTTGFDIDPVRVTQLNDGFDCTLEVNENLLRTTSLKITCDINDLRDHDFFIVTVPTPVSFDGAPDLSALKNVSELLGQIIGPQSIVVFESTVYPGVTEQFCGPIIEQVSGLCSGKDFYLGYSPERINPGDLLHTVEKMPKVIASQTPEVTNILKEIYGRINQGNIFIAKNIATAEAAKVIENAQRDINVAFINEVTQIVNRHNLSIYDVLDAAETKWNFLPFRPGFVGGHCIGVDPYYLAYCAKQVGITPEVILSGRNINESMGTFVASLIDKHIGKNKSILVLGLTFKENIPDLRNSKIVDFIKVLKELGHTIDIHDPFADPQEAFNQYGLSVIDILRDVGPYDCVIGAVKHAPYVQLGVNDFQRLLKPSGFIADIKGMWRDISWPDDIQYWTL